MLEEDGEDVGFTNMSEGCNVCPPKAWEGGRPVRYCIVPRGKWMCCERCGGSYGQVAHSSQAQGELSVGPVVTNNGRMNEENQNG